MNQFDNPFHDLWLTEILSPQDFVRMFSPKIIEFSEDLFGTGNVVVRGRQGSGKSMLLRLLDTNTRVAYALSGEDCPIPPNRSFFCGSVNLTRANISSMSSRLPRNPESDDKEWAAATFSDILNLSLAVDLLRNLSELANRQRKEESLRSILEVDLSTKAQRQLCEDLNSDTSWYGIFEECKSVADILKTSRIRLDHYRAYFNFNLDDLDEEVLKTRAEVGEPASKLAESLRSSGIIPDDCLVYFKIDQHEELFELEAETGLGDVFRQVINKCLAGRDHRCAYRIGTRHYSWSQQVKIWGTSARLENLRDYSVVDIDGIFRRAENSKIGNKAFTSFAGDVFRRRLNAAGISELSSTGLVKQVFGATPLAPERASAFKIPQEKFRRKYPEHWASEWIELLVQLREDAPLDSKLGEAWLLQETQIQKRVARNGSLASSMPWQTRQWWKKERNEVAIMQLASESGQNMIWFGERHVINLSGGNILAFMSICRTIWSGWLRQMDEAKLAGTVVPSINRSIQTVGIYEASKLWVDKLREGQNGELRRKLVFQLAEWFVVTLKQDRSLSNPGHNGFSLLRTEFERDSPITQIIRSCRDYGDLIESPHTSKIRTGERVKWYLNPVLCPYFGLPHVRTKEPIYTDLAELKRVFSGEFRTASAARPENAELFE